MLTVIFFVLSVIVAIYLFLHIPAALYLQYKLNQKSPGIRIEFTINPVLYIVSFVLMAMTGISWFFGW